jgi:sortase A
MCIYRVLRGIGVSLVTLGILVLLFVGYELWGTGLLTAAHQRALRTEFDHRLAVGRPPPRPGPGEQPGDGQPIGVIRIPAIGIDDVVVQGTDPTDLEKGPGHYAGTPMPGDPGNAAIAGHRTTYLHPFYDLNELRDGDPIYVTTVQGTFRYDVTGSAVVQPTDVAVLDPTSTPTLTLTTCNPRYSAATRLVVTASLVESAGWGKAPGPPQPVAGATAPPAPAGWVGAATWGLACAGLVVITVANCRRRRRAWVVLGAATLVALFYFFGALSPLLPPGY